MRHQAEPKVKLFRMLVGEDERSNDQRSGDQRSKNERSKDERSTPSPLPVNPPAARPPERPRAPEGTATPSPAPKRPTSTPAIVKHAGLLDPSELSRLGRVEVIANRIVEGFLSGRHRSPYKGSSVEFAEHRPYTPGDEIRSIDWRVWAKSDRYYIKQYEEETNLQALLVVDASGSMGFGLSTVSKLRYAQMTAAILARLLLGQQDGAGLAVIDNTLRTYIPPRSNPRHYMVITNELEKVQPRDETSLAPVLHELAARLRHRGLVIICSDFFDDVDALRGALHHLHFRGQEVLLVQIMAPEELTFPFDNWSQFVDMEMDGRRLNLDPPTIRKQYLAQIRQFLADFEQMAGELGMDAIRLTTDQPLGEALGAFLLQREAAKKRRAGKGGRAGGMVRKT